LLKLQIVGVVIFSLPKEDSNSIRLDHIEVLSSMRRTGVGTALMKKLFEKAQELAKTKIVIEIPLNPKERFDKFTFGYFQKEIELKVMKIFFYAFLRKNQLEFSEKTCEIPIGSLN
jgi:GNAT superfamily N-acetyltransferase